MAKYQREILRGDFDDILNALHQAVLGKLAGGSAKLVVASAQAALQYTMPPQALARRIRRLRAS